MESLIYFLLFAGLFVVMMRFGCGAHVMGHGHRHSGSAPRDQGASGGETPMRAPEKAIDPVCKMTVETASAKSSVYAGNVYYFCSQDCRGKFERDPASYVGASAPRSTTTEHGHGSHH